MNWMAGPTLALAVMLYALGSWSWRHSRTPVSRGLTASVAIFLSIPGVLFTTYYAHLIAETSSTYVTGDPLVGRQEWPKDKVRQQFDFTGFFMEIHKK
jgi:ABC-type Fe3+ transport system permease subunit